MTNQTDQDNNSLDEFEESPANQPQARRATPNRPFIIAVGAIALIFVVGLIFLLYTLFSRGPQQSSQARDQAATINAQNALVAANATADQKRAVQQQQQTLEAAIKATATGTPTVPAAPSGVTPTSVLAIPTSTGTPTATVSAQMASQTAAAATTKTGGTGGNKYPPPGPGTPLAGTLVSGGTPGAGPTPGIGTPQPTSTGLPTTGFADEMGLPGLFGIAALLVVIIFVARRARQGH